MESSASTSWNKRLRHERTLRNWRQQDLADQLGTTLTTIKRWERGTQHPSAYFRVKLCALFGVSAQDLFGGIVRQEQSEETQDRSTASETVGLVRSQHLDDETHQTVLFLHWSVPFARNPFFTGREEILQTLHVRLGNHQAIALTQSYALHGLGGIGKTQIVLEYAYRYALDYRAVFWIGAETVETIISSLLRIAEVLQLPGREGQGERARTCLGWSPRSNAGS